MKKRWIIILGVAAAIMSCSSPKALEYKTYHNFAIRDLGFTESTVSLDLEYYNPNNFGLQLKNTDLDIYIDGKMLGHSTSDSLIQIPRKKTFLLPVTFKVDMRNAFKNAWNTLSGKEVSLRLSGKIKLGKGNVFMSLPVEYESKQTFSMF